jgi:PhnB protein
MAGKQLLSFTRERLCSILAHRFLQEAPGRFPARLAGPPPTTGPKEDTAMAVKAVPDGFYTVTPYLVVHNAATAIEFYKKAFGAKELLRFPVPGGKIAHAELKIGNSPIMLADEFPEMGARSPQALGGSPVGLCLYVEDVDALTQQAIAAGAKVVRPVQDQFYGDRSGTVTDPYGHQWTIATHKEDVPVEEMQRRMADMQSQACS